ncbi:aminoglycoside phosphotransferase family protein [Rhodotorula paludigena]|uniref:aminoglycoside phosphotransferase family protein n=1 Tax=Rhodotorula paludigena TaxID=86838 RepID=UPI00316B49AB
MRCLPPAPPPPSRFPLKSVAKSPFQAPSHGSDRPLALTNLPSPSYVRSHGALVTQDEDDFLASGFEPQDIAVVRRLAWQGVDMAIKYGQRVSVGEATVMRLVREHTSIPYGLQVYGTVQEGGVTYIYQEWIAGGTLSDEWPTLSTSSRQAALAHLSSIANELSSVTAPSGAQLGPFDVDRPHAGLQHTLRLTCDDAPLLPLKAPIHSVAELESALDAIHRLRHGRSLPASLRELVSPDSGKAPSPISLVHGDLLPRNVLVRPSDGTVVALIDWEYAAWAPRWVEGYAAIVSSGHFFRPGLLPDTHDEVADVQVAAALCGGMGEAKRWLALYFSLYR